MARLRKVVVSSVAVAEIDKAYCFPVLGKELLTTLESTAMRSFWIRIAREFGLVVRLHDYIVGKDPRVVEATFQGACGAIGPSTGRASATGRDGPKPTISRADKIVAKSKPFDHLGRAVGSIENPSPGWKTGIVFDDQVVRKIRVLVGCNHP